MEEIMRLRALKQSCLAIAQIIAIAVCLIAPSVAQTPTSTPSTPATSTGSTLSAPLAKLAKRAGGLAEVIGKELEGPLLPFLEELSGLLGGFIVVAAFARMWRENSGAGVDLLWWFARLCVIFALLGNGPTIINEMANIGRKIAGIEGNSNTALQQFYKKQRADFDAAFKSFNDGAFKVRGTPVNPAPGGFMGVISSNEPSVLGPVRKFETISKSMPLLFDSMNVSRSVISFG